MPINFFSKILGNHPAGGVTAEQPAASPTDAADAVDEARAPNGVEQVHQGEAEVAGEACQGKLGCGASKIPVGASDTGAGNSVFGTMVAEKSGQGGAVGLPARPQRDDFADDASFDQAYLSYQDAHLAALRDRHPKAFCRGEVYYGCDLPPEQVLKDGIPAKRGENFDLADHQRELVDADHPERSSALRGSCRDARMPGKFAGEGGYVYILEPRGGAFSLMDALGLDDKLPEELELPFGSRQLARQIKGYRKVGAYAWGAEAYRLGPLVENPGFDPEK